MAKKETKATEEIVKEENAAGAAEATGNAENAEVTEPAENSVSATEATETVETSATDEGKFDTARAPVSVDEERVTVVMPRYLFTTDPDAEHHDVVDQGKIYRVKYDEPLEVPVSVANIINDAIAQKKKVKALIASMSGKAKEIDRE